MTADRADVSSRPSSNITDVLRTDVLRGGLLPGTRLVELQLAERYGVSRAAVRTAIGELVKEGLVDREANRGATVRRIAIDEAIQISEVRGLLEGLIAARAAVVAGDDERAELTGILERMHAAVQADRRAEYSELNRVLHRRLRDISGHEVAADLVENLRNRASAHDFRLAMVPGRAAESLGQHAAIVHAVVAGDAAGAEAAMRTHLASVADVLRHWLSAGALA